MITFSLTHTFFLGPLSPDQRRQGIRFQNGQGLGVVRPATRRLPTFGEMAGSGGTRGIQQLRGIFLIVILIVTIIVVYMLTFGVY